MGQYFKFVNLDKKEVINMWDLGYFAKFWEVCANDTGLLWNFLLRKSDETGGGDIDVSKYKYLGRWAGDRVMLIGDYDSSGLYDKCKNYKDISKEIRKEFRRFIKWVRK